MVFCHSNRKITKTVPIMQRQDFRKGAKPCNGPSHLLILTVWFSWLCAWDLLKLLTPWHDVVLCKIHLEEPYNWIIRQKKNPQKPFLMSSVLLWLCVGPHFELTSATWSEGGIHPKERSLEDMAKRRVSWCHWHILKGQRRDPLCRIDMDRKVSADLRHILSIHSDPSCSRYLHSYIPSSSWGSLMSCFFWFFQLPMRHKWSSIPHSGGNRSPERPSGGTR